MGSRPPQQHHPHHHSHQHHHHQQQQQQQHSPSPPPNSSNQSEQQQTGSVRCRRPDCPNAVADPAQMNGFCSNECVLNQVRKITR